ncbi:MAG: histidine phosphatase family protein [Bacteroidales bacterium]|nr:histidine phosphatase family protein [Bacteroidales bacterium]
MLDLRNIDPNKKNAALIRHTERYTIKDGESGDDINITPDGKKMAIEYGKSTQNKILNKIFTSPIKRCIQTAEQIINGYNKQVEIISTKMLGDPSAFVKDQKLAYSHFTKTSFFDGYYKLIRGGERPGFYSLEEGAQRMDNFIKENTTTKGLTLFISHDIVILYYIYTKTKKVYSAENWLDFLDGILVTFD